MEIQLSPIDYATRFFSPYRMPALLMVSGFFLAPSLKKTFAEYYGCKLRKLAWPYLLWGCIFATTSGAAPGDALQSEYWRGGPLHLWFLAVLIVAYGMAPVGRVLRVPNLVIVLGLLAALVASDASTTLFYGAFFFLGAAIQHLLPTIQALKAWFPWVSGAAGISIGFAAALLPLLGLLAVVWAGPHLPRAPSLEQIGTRSIVYCIMHFPAAAYTAGFLHPHLEGSPVLLWLVVLVASIAIPIVLTKVHGYVRWAFESPPLSPLTPHIRSATESRTFVR